MTWFAVIGTSPFMDTSTVTGPYRTERAALDASDTLEDKGWNTEITELDAVSNVPNVSNEEGADL